MNQDTRGPGVHFPPTVFGPKLALPASSLTAQNPGLDQSWCCGHGTKNCSLFFFNLLIVP